MNFKELLLRAQAGDQRAQEKLLSLYQPLLMKESVVNGLFDEDVYQALALKTCVNGRKVYGGPARESVEKQIKLIEDFVEERKG